jgi:hypothetical protein
LTSDNLAVWVEGVCVHSGTLALIRGFRCSILLSRGALLTRALMTTTMVVEVVVVEMMMMVMMMMMMIAH